MSNLIHINSYLLVLRIFCWKPFSANTQEIRVIYISEFFLILQSNLYVMKFFTLKFHSSSIAKCMWCSYSFWQRWRYVINYSSLSVSILCNWNLRYFLEVVLTLIQKGGHFIRYDLVEQFTSNTICFIFRYYQHKKKAYSSKIHGKLIGRNYTDNNEDAIKTLHAGRMCQSWREKWDVFLVFLRRNSCLYSAANPLAAGKLGTDSSSLDRRCPSRISIYITVVPCNEVEMEYPERRDRDSPGLPATN